MAIDLPPALPPELATTTQLASVSNESPIATTAAGYKVIVTGNSLLEPEQIKKLLSEYDDLSRAVRQLTAAYRLKGYLLVKVMYVLDGQTLRIHVVEGCVREVVAGEALQNYVDNMQGGCNITAAQFNDNTLLASLVAERAGQKISSNYVLDGLNKQGILQFDATPQAGYSPVGMTITAGNPGNRFLGRYFAGASLYQDMDSGGRFTAGYNKALTSVGSNPRGGTGLDAYQIGYNRITPVGVFGFGASYVEYGQRFNPFDLEAEILQIDLNAQKLLASKPSTRWVLDGRLLYVDSVIEEQLTQTNLQDENYAAIEIGTRYNSPVQLYGLNMQGNISGLIRQGLTGDKGTLDSNARRGNFTLARASGGVLMGLLQSMKLSFSLDIQYAADRLPQQQQWVLGGLNSLSAWLPGVLTGDSGGYANLSLGFQPWQLWRGPLTMNLFAEIGSSQFEDISGPAGDRFTLSDAGIRFDWQIFEKLRLTLIAAEPLSDDDLPAAFLDDLESDAFFSFNWTL